MINKIPELKRLELNKENVMKVLFDCKATENSTNTITSTFYSKTSTRKAPPVKLDTTKLFSYSNLISYLFGQLKSIHKRQETMSPAEGIFNYKGEKWTDDNRALFALYYLGTADVIFPKFIDGEKSAITPDLSTRYDGLLTPTFAPYDPNFKLEDAASALRELGVKLPSNLRDSDYIEI